MKSQLIKLIPIFSTAILACLNLNKAQAQSCPSGYTQASLNWDNQYFKTVPSSGIKYMFGINTLQFAWSGATMNGVNGSNTASGTSYGGGNDVQYTVSNGNTITLTFANEVQNLKFAIHDIDTSNILSVSATNAAATALNVTMTSISGANLTVSGSGTTTATATSGTVNVASSSADGSVNIDIAGPVKTITLTCTKATGSDDIWITDLSACVNGTWPNAYQAISAPYAGMDDFMVAAVDNSVAAINHNTGAVIKLYTDNSVSTINSIGYDPYNKVVYYVDNANATSKSVFKYDITTGVKSTLIADVTTLGIQLTGAALGYGAGCFYNGSYFLGAEYNSTGDPQSIWRIDIASGAVTNVCRVYGVSGSKYDWGDFAISNGTLYTFNSSSSAASNTNIQHFDLNAQNFVVGYTASMNSDQVSLDYNDNIIDLNATPSLATYNLTGGFSSRTSITGLGSSGITDGGEAIKLKFDFGDAPSTYGRAYHLQTPTSNLKIGSSIDYEPADTSNAAASFDDNKNTGSMDDEEGVSSFTTLSTSTINYSVTVAVTNTTGSSATLYGWIDFNRNGIFDAAEKSTATTVANGATSVTVTWSNIASTVSGVSYARFRLATASSELSSASGAASTGEVEDYQLTILQSTVTNILGTIINDLNGKTDNTISGSGIGNPGSSQLYAYLVYGGNVQRKSTVNITTGVFTLDSAALNTNYNLVVSTTNVAIGASAPSQANLPTDWYAVGESFGTNNNAGSGIESGTPDLQIAVNTSTLNVSGILLSVEKAPSNPNQIYTIPTPSAGSIKALTSSNSMGKLTATDFEQGTLSSGSSNTITITSVAGLNGNILFYDANGNGTLNTGEELTTGSVFTYSASSKLMIALVDLTPGNLQFNFSFLDQASKSSATPGTYQVNWSVVLPVSYLYFTAQPEGNNVKLDWATGSETNNDYFIIERSFDQIDWTEIANKKSTGNKTGDGYNLLDEKPMNGINFYRIKQVNIDGAYNYSNVAYCTFKNDNESGENISLLHSFENPALSISLPLNSGNNIYTLEIYNSAGQIVITMPEFSITDGTTEIKNLDMGYLERGLYVAVLTNTTQKKKRTFKILK